MRKDISVLKDIEAIKRSVRNLIYLNVEGKFEKPFHPEIGTGIRDSLFEMNDPLARSILVDKIRYTIDNFEPRVDNLQVEVFPRPDRNEFEVTVVFDIIGQEFPTQEYSFLLEATR